MAKYTASDLTSLTSNEASAVSTINANFAGVEAAFENTLSRDGTTPNTMNADIDLNTNDLLNVGTIDADNILLNGSSVYSLSNGAAVWGAITGTLSSQTDLQAAIDGASSATLAPVSKTADFTFALADIGRTHSVSSASAVVATIPTNAAVAYPIGTKLRVYRAGTGTVKVVPAGGVTLRLPTGIAPKRRMGVYCSLSADKTAQNYSAGVSIGWDAESGDTDGFHDTVTNNSRITIPSGLGIKKVNLSVCTQTMLNSNYTDLIITKNGGDPTNAGIARSIAGIIGTNSTTGTVSLSVTATDGDYFQTFYATTDTSLTLVKGNSHFAMDVTEIDTQGWVAYQYGTIEIQKVATDEWIVSDQSALG